MIRNFFFEKLDDHARNSPQQIFLEHLESEETYTYGEVFDLVAKISTFFEIQGFGETVVLLADSSLDTVIAYCAIISSGRTIVVLDDAITSSYRMKIIKNPNSRCVSASELIQKASVMVSEDLKELASPSAHAIESVLFTSGSTGEPKIFGIPSDRPSHDMLLDYRGDDYSVLNVRRPSTTPFRRNLKRVLLHGGRFITVDLSRISATRLDQVLHGRPIREMTVTPTMVRNLFPSFKSAWINHVRVVHLNGERVALSDLEVVFEKMHQTLVRTNYGTTEHGPITEKYLQREDLSKCSDPVSVGLPLIEIEIRDESSIDVLPVGQTGTIYVRNASGYIGEFQEDGQFVFERIPQDKWIDTGDLGYFNDKGELVVLGRTQETLKVRGARISLLDVEQVVLNTGYAEKVLVASYLDARGDTALGALVVPLPAMEVTLPELRRKITQDHPLVMCPSRLILVEELPVLPSGKLDRVLASKLLNFDETEEKKFADDPTSRVVVQILEKILSVEQISLSQDVFEAGLDSLASLEVMDELSRAFGLHLDVRFLLEHPTCEQMVNAISNYMEPEGRIIEIGSPTHVVNGRFFWILPGANPYMIQKMAKVLEGYSHYGVLNHGCLPDDVVIPEIDSIVMTLVEAILNEKREDDPIFVGGFSSAAILASEVVRNLILKGVNIRGVVLLDPAGVHDDSLQLKSNRMVNPLHVMLAREGRLHALDPVQRDHALFGLQMYALDKFVPKPLNVPTLQISLSQTEVQRLMWNSHDKSQFISCDIEHLDYVRQPDVVVEHISSFLHQLTSDAPVS